MWHLHRKEAEGSVPENIVLRGGADDICDDWTPGFKDWWHCLSWRMVLLVVPKPQDRVRGFNHLAIDGFGTEVNWGEPASWIWKLDAEACALGPEWSTRPEALNVCSLAVWAWMPDKESTARDCDPHVGTPSSWHGQKAGKAVNFLNCFLGLKSGA